MAKIPGQRQPGQTGRGGKQNHTHSMGKTWDRGGNPMKGGAGGGKTPNGNGCAVVAFGALGAVVTALGAAGYGVIRIFS